MKESKNRYFTVSHRVARPPEKHPNLLNWQCFQITARARGNHSCVTPWLTEVGGFELERSLSRCLTNCFNSRWGIFCH